MGALFLSQRNLNLVVDGIMKLIEMVLYSGLFLLAVGCMIWIFIAFLVTLLGGLEIY